LLPELSLVYGMFGLYLLLNLGENRTDDQVREDIQIIHNALDHLANKCRDFGFYVVALEGANLVYFIAMLERSLVSNDRHFLMALMTCCVERETFAAPITHNKPVGVCCTTTINFTTIVAAVTTPEEIWSSAPSPHDPAVLDHMQENLCAFYWDLMPCCAGKNKCPTHLNNDTKETALAIMAAFLAITTCAGFTNELLLHGNLVASAVLGKQVNSLMYGSTYHPDDDDVAHQADGAGPSSMPSVSSSSLTPGLENVFDKVLDPIGNIRG